MAPDAALTLYISQDTTFQSGLFLAIQRALDDNAVNILNVSFGGCEASQGQSGNQEILNFWEQAAAQGISRNKRIADNSEIAAFRSGGTKNTIRRPKRARSSV